MLDVLQETAWARASGRAAGSVISPSEVSAAGGPWDGFARKLLAAPGSIAKEGG